MSKVTAFAPLSAAFVLLAMLASSLPAAAADPAAPARRSVNVSGRGEVSATPDRGRSPARQKG